MKQTISFCVVIAVVLASTFTFAYSPRLAHKPLTLLALSVYNKCNSNEVTYKDFERREHVVLGNIAMDEGKRALPGLHKYSFANGSLAMIKRTVNWHFYNPFRERLSIQGWVDKSQTRLWKRAKEEFNKYEKNDKREFSLGGILHLVEDASVPAHVVPVYHGPVLPDFYGKFEHLVDYMKDHVENGLIKDKIDLIEPDTIALSVLIQADIGSFCKLTQTELTADAIRRSLAYKTLTMVESEIPGCDGFSWYDFWIAPEGQRYFGKYNIENGNPLFGNAGTLTKNKAGSILYCKFEKDDLRYKGFVTKLHTEAIKADLQILGWASKRLELNGSNR
ncbi:hypothetical protein [Sulfuriflexus mobilis]|uniref:hypothetical protein n=1 Tax=Sulfuriflexus mobilis TaxID=1811807 RepID=UPI000F845232|nr:hypothetical protein [Sulfuriflexus mobilis]